MRETLKKQIEFWEKSGQEDWETANFLFAGKRYAPCLFFCQLSLEKLLKGLVIINTGDSAPYTHDLERLAVLSGINVSEKQTNSFKIITRFNIASRYDDRKLSFHKIADKKFTEKYLIITKKLFIWLKNQYLKK